MREYWVQMMVKVRVGWRVGWLINRRIADNTVQSCIASMGIVQPCHPRFSQPSLTSMREISANMFISGCAESRAVEISGKLVA